jgi:mRNA interferase MazF
MNKGDLILIPFPFTDLTGNKLRPAVILIGSSKDITVCFITTQLKWKEHTDIELLPSKVNGIKKHSLIRVSKIATIDKSLVLGKLGELEDTEIEELNIKLKELFQLD